MKLSENMWFSEDFKKNISQLIRLSLLTIRISQVKLGDDPLTLITIMLLIRSKTNKTETNAMSMVALFYFRFFTKKGSWSYYRMTKKIALSKEK